MQTEFLSVYIRKALNGIPDLKEETFDSSGFSVDETWFLHPQHPTAGKKKKKEKRNEGREEWFVSQLAGALSTVNHKGLHKG